jgi:uncharacterized protein (TIGR03435 family)
MSNQLARVIGGIAVASTLVGPAVAQPPNRYALVIARPDGALGPYLHRANIDCATLRVTMTAPPSRENLPCNLRRDIGRISASGLPFEQLVGMLRVHTHLWIEDRTGLSGDFDWDLAWTPENLRATADRFPRIDPNGPSVFAALEAQLGLRLVPLNAG